MRFEVRHAANRIYENGQLGINIIVEGQGRCGKTILIDQIKDLLAKEHPKFKVSHDFIDREFVSSPISRREVRFYERSIVNCGKFIDHFGETPYIIITFSLEMYGGHTEKSYVEQANFTISVTTFTPDPSAMCE
jgi:hypothetical protein